MTDKKHLIPKSKILIREFSEQRLADRYTELLRLRQAVRQAEMLTDDRDATRESSQAINKQCGSRYAN
jgi:hypothetical protein